MMFFVKFFCCRPMVRKCIGTLLKLRLRAGVCSALAKMESLISSGGWLDGKKSNDVPSYFPRPRNISFRISALSKGIFLRRGKENVFAKRISFTVVDWTDPAPANILSANHLVTVVVCCSFCKWRAWIAIQDWARLHCRNGSVAGSSGQKFTKFTISSCPIFQRTRRASGIT